MDEMHAPSANASSIITSATGTLASKAAVVGSELGFELLLSPVPGDTIISAPTVGKPNPELGVALGVPPADDPITDNTNAVPPSQSNEFSSVCSANSALIGSLLAVSPLVLAETIPLSDANLPLGGMGPERPATSLPAPAEVGLLAAPTVAGPIERTLASAPSTLPIGGSNSTASAAVRQPVVNRAQAHPTGLEPSTKPVIDQSGQVSSPGNRDKTTRAAAAPTVFQPQSTAEPVATANLGNIDKDEGRPPTEAAPLEPDPNLPSTSSNTPRSGAHVPAARPTDPSPAPASDAVAHLVPPPPPAPAPYSPLQTALPAHQAPPTEIGQIEHADPRPLTSVRPTKGERSRGAAQAAPLSDAQPLQAAELSVRAKVVDSVENIAVKTLGTSDLVSESNAKSDAEAVAETPDVLISAETHAAIQVGAAITPSTHGMRGSPETVANLAAQIIKKLAGQSTRFELELNPHGLGKVNVRIDIGAHGQMTASMMFDSSKAAEELKSRADDLQRALEEAGFDISGGMSFDVTDDRPQRGRASYDQGETGHAFRDEAFRTALETAGRAAEAAATNAFPGRGIITGRVDLRI